MDDLTLDLRGLKCPLPALRTRKALARLPAGARLWIEATDPMAAIDIPHLVGQSEDVLEAQESRDGVLRFLIRKGG